METELAGKLILDSMNTTEDPCTDFYAYVCGNWKNSHQIADDKDILGHHQIITEKAEEDIKHILLNATTKEDEPQNATDKAIRAYRVCVCETVDERKELEDLMQLLKEKGLTKWPILKEEAVPYTNYNELLNKTGFSALIPFEIKRDAKRTDYYAIYLNRVEFRWLKQTQLIYQTEDANKKVVQAYKELIKKSVKLFRNDTDCKENETEEVSEEILQFEATLAKLSVSSDIVGNLSSLVNEADISILSEKSPGIKWLQILNNMFSDANITLDNCERVILSHPPYIYGIEKILKNTSLPTLYNYLYWTQIRRHGSASSRKFGQLVVDFDKEAFGVQAVVPLWKTCLSKISGVMKHAIIRLYVDNIFEPNAKHTVEHYVDVVNSTFGEMLENNTWLDNNTREEALKKLQKMIHKIGYPYGTLNDTYLNQLYEYVPNISLNNSFVKVFHSLLQNNFIKYLQNLHQPYKREDPWQPGAAEVGAYYNGLVNDIAFSALFLQPPFLQDNIPSSINMAAIGAVIGHEMGHAFDNTGMQYDADGNLRNWWTPAVQQEFINRAVCLVQLYNVTVKEVNMTLNGLLTLGENIADNSGLKAAYLAWKNFNDTEQLIPGLEHLTGDQLFFVSYAHIWCQDIKEGRLRYDIVNDVHSPAKYRVNLPMGNSQAFVDAFRCNESSPMNIKNKCYLW
ncbi:neprilysin-11-like [Ixodes scapularis]|uniref:neprilysin-11-like n=1 Tax=Ixodes scapularis TaxID=6945 RepID=UPI001C391936|nr:neprilysin-11-like [Ixodes scapularis]